MTTTKQPIVYQDRIIVDAEILAGKPVIKGTRIPVELVLKRLAQDLNFDSLFRSYPRLTSEDVKACLAYAVDSRMTRCVGRRSLIGSPAGISRPPSRCARRWRTALRPIS